MVLSSLGFFLPAISWAECWRWWHPRNASHERREKLQQRTRKRATQEDRKVLEIAALLQPNTTEKNIGPTSTPPTPAEAKGEAQTSTLTSLQQDVPVSLPTAGMVSEEAKQGAFSYICLYTNVQHFYLQQPNKYQEVLEQVNG